MWVDKPQTKIDSVEIQLTATLNPEFKLMFVLFTIETTLGGVTRAKMYIQMNLKPQHWFDLTHGLEVLCTQTRL